MKSLTCLGPQENEQVDEGKVQDGDFSCSYSRNFSIKRIDTGGYGRSLSACLYQTCLTSIAQLQKSPQSITF